MRARHKAGLQRMIGLLSVITALIPLFADVLQVDRDTQLNSLSGPFFDYTSYNYGASDTFNLSDANHVLLYFDFSGASLTITSAVLNLRAVSPVSGSGTRTLTAYALEAANRAWEEGAQSGSPAAGGEPAWDYRQAYSNTWAGSAGASTAGTDYESTPLGSVTAGITSEWWRISLDAATIEAWRTDTNSNHGLLIDITGGNSFIPVGSREHADVNYRPTVDYFLIPEPVTVWLVAGGLLLLINRRRRGLKSNC